MNRENMELNFKSYKKEIKSIRKKRKSDNAVFFITRKLMII